ncbi:lysylphosphatidylglycerol synthase transmembrane domain-containing protein [Kineosporia mesophila]|uniref:Lysylphosphatidylglycerol synthase transmembrane domain-containing protein n=1 Tax=Kineosporia mesophila TaxID=566012 RepID=A0ABP6ZVC1_9ACTN|nr:lysylphosphatidylglycerol synthase domain-containing protein [Kineosporia mesophila]MCD5355242.1 lysylphosphatidylglycerol synthase domain-containing protein [Kineosporia mesophila]
MNRRVVARRLVMIVVVTAAVWFMARPVVAEPTQTLSALGALGPGVFLFGLAVLMVGVVMTTLAWREPLQEIGEALSSGEALKIFAAGQLGKYIPGTLWSLLWQAGLAARHGISPTQIGLAFGVHALVSLATGAAVGLLAAGALLEGVRLVALIVAVLAGLLITPAAVSQGLRLLLRVPWLASRAAPVPTTVLVRSTLWSAGSWLLSGCHLWLIVHTLGAPLTPRVAMVSIGGFALATALGSVVILVPDGLGVREALLVTVLSTCLPPAGAVVAATASRLLLTAADLVAFAYGAWSARRDRSILPVTPGEAL